MIAGSRRCLVVDDSRVVRKVARRILEGQGCDVTETENGAEALAACHKALPDCVLLDWYMPVMNGLAFLQALRAAFGPDKPLVIFCTMENDAAQISLACAHGAQGYIVKPFDADMLIGKFTQLGLL